jgi:hypothetical protein
LAEDLACNNSLIVVTFLNPPQQKNEQVPQFLPLLKSLSKTLPVRFAVEFHRFAKFVAQSLISITLESDKALVLCRSDRA